MYTFHCMHFIVYNCCIFKLAILNLFIYVLLYSRNVWLYSIFDTVMHLCYIPMTYVAETCLGSCHPNLRLSYHLSFRHLDFSHPYRMKIISTGFMKYPPSAAPQEPKYMHFTLLDQHRKYYLIYSSQPLKPWAGDTQQMGPMETGGTTIGDPLPSLKCPGVGRCGHLSGSPDRWPTTLTQAMKYVWKEDVTS